MGASLTKQSSVVAEKTRTKSGTSKNKILVGLTEAREVARGNRLPAKATLFGWAVMLPGGILTCNICGDRMAAWEEAANMVGNGGIPLAKKAGFRIVRVKIETVRSKAAVVADRFSPALEKAI